MIIEEIKNINSSKKELRKFGWQVGGVLAGIGVLLWVFNAYSYYYISLIGTLLILAGLMAPVLLYPIHKAWMTLAILLGFVMTRVILSILYYLIITPIGFVARLSGKDFLDLKIEKDKQSYWNYREVKEYEKVDTERQF